MEYPRGLFLPLLSNLTGSIKSVEYSNQCPKYILL